MLGLLGSSRAGSRKDRGRLVRLMSGRSRSVELSKLPQAAEIARGRLAGPVVRPLGLRHFTNVDVAVGVDRDYVRADTDGYLYYIGRRDELLKSRGIRVTTTEIETEIRASGLVRDAVVTAVDTDGPDPLLLAAVTLANGTSNLTDLSAYCRRELAPHLQPHEIVVLETMPTTSRS